MKCVVAMEKLHQHKTTLGISETNCGSKDTKVALENARYNSSVDPTCIRLNTSVEPVRKSRQHREKTAPVKLTKSKLNAGAVVQRDTKMNFVSTG